MPQKRLAPTKRGTPSAAPQGLQDPQDEQPIAFIVMLDRNGTGLVTQCPEAQTKLYLDDETEQQQQSAQNKPFDLYGYLLKVVVVLLVLLGGLYQASMVIKRRQQQGGTASIPQATPDTPASPHFLDLRHARQHPAPGMDGQPGSLWSRPDYSSRRRQGRATHTPASQSAGTVFQVAWLDFLTPPAREPCIGLSAQLPQVPQMPGPEAVDVPMSVIKRYALSDTHQIVVVEVAGERMLLGVTPRPLPRSSKSRH
ncbi:MAG: flagellar biosynthetic protein FliO [Vampirovibrionales bacterium]